MRNRKGCLYQRAYLLELRIYFLKSFILNEVSQIEKEKYRMTSLLGGIKRNYTNELTKQKETHIYSSAQ